MFVEGNRFVATVSSTEGVRSRISPRLHVQSRPKPGGTVFAVVKKGSLTYHVSTGHFRPERVKNNGRF